MKFTRYHKILVFCSALLFLGACQDDMLEEATSETYTDPEDDGMVEVSFNLNFDDFTNSGFGSRTDEGDLQDDEHEDYIIVYALRDMNDKVLSQYGQGVDPCFKNAEGKINRDEFPALRYYIEDTDNNQTLKRIDNFNVNNPRQTVYNFTLRVMRNTKFKLSVWVQSTKCTVYDFNYLSAVMVRYNENEAFNNKQNRDAFCATSIFSIGQVDSKVQMTLTRPFAQVNVAIDRDNTSEEDYLKYEESEIVFENAASYFNVVENKTWSEDDYKQYFDEKQAGKTNYNKRIFYDGDIEDEEIRDGINLNYRTPNLIKTTAKFPMYAINRDELEISNYKGWGSSDNPTVTKKYYRSLSMSYVLVHESAYNPDSEGNYTEDGYATDKDGNAWVTITDFFGNAVTLKNANPKPKDPEDIPGEWIINKVISPNDEVVTDKYTTQPATNKNTFGAIKGGKTITQYYEEYERLEEADGQISYGDKLIATVSLEYIIKERRWKVVEAKDGAGNDITGSYKYESDYNGGVIYPGTPDEQKVQLTLLSLLLKGNNTGIPDLKYSVPKQLPVRRNWRTNLLFENWDQLKNPSNQ